MLFSRQKVTMVTPDDALAGRDTRPFIGADASTTC